MRQDAMTTAQHMLAGLSRSRRARTGANAAGRGLSLLCAIVALAPLGACDTMPREKHVPPATLTAPYALFMPERNDALFAVAPLRNESGTSVVDTMTVSDALTKQLHEVRGVTVVPLNRTLGAMRVLGLRSVDTPDDAHALIETLGVDALVVGTITAYDPYNPPKMGMSLALFVRPGSLMTAGSVRRESVDSRAIRASATEEGVPFPEWERAPASVASEHLDGANHDVQAAVRTYGEGRSSTVSALGWRRYLASMPLYADFVCYRLTERLLESERLRLQRTNEHAAR